MFIPLMNDRGERIYVNMMLVQCLMPFDATHADSYERRCRSGISCAGGYYRVRETVEEIRALMGTGDQTP
jgi:hypothetical protein